MSDFHRHGGQRPFQLQQQLRCLTETSGCAPALVNHPSSSITTEFQLKVPGL
jgi:hypothetical protein